MPSYLITGTSRGLGFEFMRQISANPNNVVVGLVRDKAATDKKVLAELNRPNIHIVQADLTDYDSLKESLDVVTPIVDGSLDYIIANAGYISKWSQYDAIGVLGERDPKRLEADMLDSFRTNVIGNVHLFNLYLPLVLRGGAKKVIAISSGMADTALARDWKLVLSAPYSASKTAMNAVAVKFHAQYADRGVLFLSICPGSVDTGVYDGATEEQMQGVLAQGAAFMQYSPRFRGPIPPAESVGKILPLVYRASLEGGYGGDFIPHLGKGEKWL
ncbi:putative short chain dehydrogenase protein [Rosellinia necatrix]|uniref:Putative short chain dehydrogenase protein n=1 Tax=Rosellinia necatrix TaxID=77044 RepID=A0A1S7UK23_ROSNE|nr:putative short chain dehydrogenase protein [Rosellinia necatrix]